MRRNINRSFYVTLFISFLVIFYPYQYQAFAKDNSCYSLKNKNFSIKKNNFKESDLLAFEDDQVCIDWYRFQSHTHYEALKAIYSIAVHLKTLEEETVYNTPEAKYPFLQAVFQTQRKFLRNPAKEHDLSKIHGPMSFPGGFLVRGNEDNESIIPKLKHEGGLWFPSDEVLQKHAKMGIVEAEEMWANRLMTKNFSFVQLSAGDVSRVNILAYDIYKNNNDFLSQSALISGLYELFSGDQNGIKSLLKAVEMKNADAMFWLGFLYLDGKYLPQDLEKSRIWFEKGNTHNSQQAKAMLALAYKFGTYGFFDLEKSYKYMNELAKLGDVRDAQIKDTYFTYVASLDEKSGEIIALEKSAADGFYSAVDSLCQIYTFGPEFFGEKYLKNMKEMNVQYREKVQEWCVSSALQGSTAGASSMVALYVDPKTGGTTNMAQLTKWVLILHELTLQRRKTNPVRMSESELIRREMEDKGQKMFRLKLRKEFGDAGFNEAQSAAMEFLKQVDFE